jgi:hypothetical protein
LHALGQLDGVVICERRQISDTLSAQVVLEHFSGIWVDNFIKNLIE